MYKKRMEVTAFFLASVFLLCVSAGAAQQVEKVTKIWDRAPHCAFTDLIRFKNKWFCTFREGEKHVSVVRGRP